MPSFPAPTLAQRGVSVRLLLVLMFAPFALSCLVGLAASFGRGARRAVPRRAEESRRATRRGVLPLMLFSLDQVADPVRNRRINLVIGACLNRFSPDVASARRRYLGWLGGALPPVNARPEDLVLGDVASDPAECATALRAAAAIAPGDVALEVAGEQYLVAVRSAAATLNPAYSYYRNRDWQDDGMARGRALHPALRATFEAFGRAHTALAAQVEAAQRESPTRPCVARAGIEGFACEAARHQRLARWVTQRAAGVTVAADGTIAGLDLSAFATELAALEASVGVLSALVPQALSGIGRIDPVEYEWKAQAHLREVKSLFRAARDHQRVDVDDWNTPESDPAGSPAGIISAFNDTVRDFNWR